MKRCLPRKTFSAVFMLVKKMKKPFSSIKIASTAVSMLIFLAATIFLQPHPYHLRMKQDLKCICKAKMQQRRLVNHLSKQV